MRQERSLPIVIVCGGCEEDGVFVFRLDGKGREMGVSERDLYDGVG